MPKVAGIKVPTKERKIRNPLFVDEKYTGAEPVWDAEDAVNYTDEEFDHRMRKSFFYYNYFYNQKDCRPQLNDWIKSSGQFTGDEVKALLKSDRWVPMTVCNLIMSHRAGMPLKDKHVAYLKATLLNSIEEKVESKTGAAPEKEKVKTAEQVAAKPSIQDRLAEKTAETLGEIEGFYDQVIRNEKSDFKCYDFLTANKVPQAQLGKYERVFQYHKDELELARSKSDPQLTEAYSHYRAADFRRLIAFWETCLSDLEQYRDVKKATKKARVKKAPNKEKQVAKLKFCKEFKPLKLVSVSPVSILGSRELWVYNTKTRKLGKYVAEEYKDLQIKGTTILNYDESASVQKTLRKPEEQLKEFARAGKIALRKFLQDIKSVEVKMNGRINEDIVLLKVA